MNDDEIGTLRICTVNVPFQFIDEMKKLTGENG
jgi:hypothetical protein